MATLRSRAAGFLRKKLFDYLQPLHQYLGGWLRVFESHPGAWQQNYTVDRQAVTAQWAFFSCVTLIAQDISKLYPEVIQFNKTTQIWEPTENRPVLRKPNQFQNYIEFLFDWVRCLLLHGNAYILKLRDEKRFIVRMYVLDPCRVTPLVADGGAVYYQLNTDNLAGLDIETIVPASEIIHDRINALHHPLIGCSPVYACGVAASMGMAIESNSANFFTNMSRPSGILEAPGAISPETVAAMKLQWADNFHGSNFGKLAVVGDGLKYSPMHVNAADSQLIEQLKITAEMICATLHVPPHKIGMGQMPTVQNTAVLNQQYYDQCLQHPIEKIELRLAEGLELLPGFEVRLDLGALLRMDPQARYKSQIERVGGGILKPNEARREENLPPVPGGDSCYLQQQNFSLDALAKRDAKEDPFASAGATPKPPAKEPEEDQTEKMIALLASLEPEEFFNA